jgi:hypothetical protein
VFDQYLRTTLVPKFEYKIKKGTLSYRWTNVVKGFAMPMRIKSGDEVLTLYPEEKWKKIKISSDKINPDRNFYVK